MHLAAHWRTGRSLKSPLFFTGAAKSAAAPHANEDLNAVPEAELERRKRDMDKQFGANLLKPGDAGFQYDKRVDFDAANAAPSDWD